VVAHYVFISTLTPFWEWLMPTSGSFAFYIWGRQVMDLILQWEYQRQPKLSWCAFSTCAHNFICLWEGHTEIWSVCTGAVLTTTWKSASSHVQRLSQFCGFPELHIVKRASDSVNCSENIRSYSNFFFKSEGCNIALT